MARPGDVFSKETKPRNSSGGCEDAGNQATGDGIDLVGLVVIIGRFVCDRSVDVVPKG